MPSVAFIFTVLPELAQKRLIFKFTNSCWHLHLPNKNSSVKSARTANCLKNAVLVYTTVFNLQPYGRMETVSLARINLLERIWPGNARYCTPLLYTILHSTFCLCGPLIFFIQGKNYNSLRKQNLHNIFLYIRHVKLVRVRGQYW